MVVPGGGSVWNGRGHVGWDGTGRGGGRTIADLAGHAEVSPEDARSSGTLRVAEGDAKLRPTRLKAPVTSRGESGWGMARPPST